MRRRMGAPSSHLGMAVGPPETERRISGFSLPGPSHMPGVPDQYSAGPAPLAKDSSEFAEAVSSTMANEPHGGRSRGVADTSAGARLTISPSMKVPTESPAPVQGDGRVVQSFRGRSFTDFNRGRSETYQDGR